MGIKPIFLDEKLRMGVLLVPMIKKYKVTDKKSSIFTCFLSKLGEFCFMFCYDLAHSTAERARFLGLDTSLAT